MSELNKKTVKELESVCKELGLTYYVGKKHLTKSEMIEKIESASIEVGTDDDEIEENVEKTNEENLAKIFSEEEKRKKKIAIVEKAEVGTLIAFVDNRGKARTAALVNRSSKKGLVKLVTEYDREYVVDYDNILWVQKPGNKRWPKGVYSMLKGLTNGTEEVVNR